MSNVIQEMAKMPVEHAICVGTLILAQQAVLKAVRAAKAKKAEEKKEKADSVTPRDEMIDE